MVNLYEDGELVEKDVPEVKAVGRLMEIIDSKDRY